MRKLKREIGIRKWDSKVRKVGEQTEEKKGLKVERENWVRKQKESRGKCGRKNRVRKLKVKHRMKKLREIVRSWIRK